MKSKPEPGEVSPLNSSTSSKKDGCLKRGMHDSEEEGDLLEDEDEVRRGMETGARAESTYVINKVFFLPLVQKKFRGRAEEEDGEEEEGEQEEGEDNGDES